MARRSGLDTARTLATAFVVAAHAAISYMVTPIGWAIQDTSRNLGVDLFVWVVRAAVMPVFFWLSGYFARDVYERKGPLGFVRSRATRILVPFALAIVPCSLALDALWDWGRELAGRPDVAANIPKLEASTLPLTLGHLWFLYYLLIISALATAIVEAGRRVRARPPIWSVPILAITPLVHAGSLQLDTPLGFRIDPWVTLYFGAFFLWGWLVHARRTALAWYVQHAWRCLAIAALLLAAVLPALGHATAPIDAPVYAIVASGALTFAMVAAFIGLCVRTTRHLVSRFASDASYWTYITHVPLVVVLQIAFATVSWPGPLEYLAIVGATVFACLVSYAAIARVRGSLAAPRRSTGTPARARSGDTQ